MNQIFTPGQTVYVLFWRRPEETELTRVTLYATKRGRNKANIDLLTLGLITMTDTWKIPAPVRQADSSDGATRKETINLPASF